MPATHSRQRGGGILERKQREKCTTPLTNSFLLDRILPSDLSFLSYVMCAGEEEELDPKESIQKGEIAWLHAEDASGENSTASPTARAAADILRRHQQQQQRQSIQLSRPGSAQLAQGTP